MISRRKLLKLIQEQGLKNWQVAQHAGISKATLSRLISGRHIPSERVLLRVAQALGVSDEEIRDDLTPDPALITSRRALDLALQPNPKKAKRFRDAIETLWNATFRLVDYEQECIEEFAATNDTAKAADDTIDANDTTDTENQEK